MLPTCRWCPVAASSLTATSKGRCGSGSRPVTTSGRSTLRYRSRSASPMTLIWSASCAAFDPVRSGVRKRYGARKYAATSGRLTTFLSSGARASESARTGDFGGEETFPKRNPPSSARAYDRNSGTAVSVRCAPASAAMLAPPPMPTTITSAISMRQRVRSSARAETQRCSYDDICPERDSIQKQIQPRRPQQAKGGGRPRRWEVAITWSSGVARRASMTCIAG